MRQPRHSSAGGGSPRGEAARNGRRAPPGRGLRRDPGRRGALWARREPARRPLKTLERALSKAGLASRTEARQWIAAGRIAVNGKIERDPNRWVDLERDRVAIDGAPLRPASKTYLLLYKPKGYLTTYADPAGRPTVYDLVDGAGTWLIPVGRLDRDTSGLLLMTNDTAFAERVSNPAHGIVKTYEVKAAALVSDEQIERLRAGVELKDGPTRPAAVRRLRDGPRHTHLEIAIGEGRNRQVRRMMEAIGSKALKLVRTAIGPIRIGELPIGKWRWLRPEEVRALGGAAGLGEATGAGLAAAGPRARRRVNRGRYRGSGA